MKRSGGRQKEGSKAGRRGRKKGEEEEKGDEAALATGVGWKISGCRFQLHLLSLLLHKPTITGFQ